LRKIHEEYEIDDHDVGIDNPPLSIVWREDEKKYYILNVSDKAPLKNGFRYKGITITVSSFQNV